MRKTIVIILSFTIFLLLAYSSYRAYELWNQSHWMTLAKGFAIKGDAHNEFLCLEQALNVNPRNVDACRMIANMAEAAHSRSALIWREKVLQLAPDSLMDRLALAQTALFARDYKTAQNALDGVDDAGKKTAAYYNISAQLVLSEGKLAEAESDFEEAARIDPANPAPLLSLSVVQLHSSNTLDAAEARITLRRLSMNSTNIAIHDQADRELVLDAMKNKDYKTALWFSKDLTQGKNALFSDKLIRLDVLKQTDNDGYIPALEDCERQAEADSSDTYYLTLWLLEHDMSGKALGWLQSLPENTRTSLPAALLLAECQMLAHDWSDLQNSLSKENWGKLDSTREAFMARALRQQGLYEASKAQWDVAVKSTANGDNELTSLYRLAAQWNWQDEAQQILWAIVNTYPQEQWAQEQLAVALYSAGSTRPLMELFNMEVNHNPSDLAAKNNLALTALLLHAQEMNPYDLAKEVYEQAPTNSFYACTYAFSLYQQGKNADALKVMQQVSPQALKNNSTAGYYGVILKAAGYNAKSSAYLKRAVRGQLLPEERAMFQQAMLGL